jgi:heme oxygenase
VRASEWRERRHEADASALERGLDAHATNPVLAGTYNPKLLARAGTLAADIRYLLQEMGHDDSPPRPDIVPTPPFPLPAFLAEVFTTTAAPLKVYLNRLNELSASPDLAPRLLAHAYVRYLGDLSGGQIIGARLRKAYNLETLDGRRFYFFDLDGDSSAAETGDETVGDRKKKLYAVKGWYRDGMDGGVGNDQKALKASLVKEANLAFILNTHLFSLINPPAPKAQEPRYYEKLEAKRAAEAAAKPPKTLAEHLITLAYVIFSVVLGMALFHVAWPTARPHVIEYGTPVWERFGAPWFYGTFTPWWNESFVPWWDHHAAPLLARQMANSRRALI